MKPAPYKIDWVVAIPMVTGSLLSFLGAGTILLCYLILPQKRHFRHALIINLAIADLMNAANNSASGLWVFATRGKMTNGPGCTANGFFGQLSVQAVDCSILMIAVVTLIYLKQLSRAQDASMSMKILLCSAAWVLPVITAFIALGMHLYHPTGGTWCWLQAKPIYLRYVLNHMWRFVVILASTGIYIYIYFYLQQHFNNIKVLGNRSYGDGSQTNSTGGRYAFLRRGRAPRKDPYGFGKLSEASVDSDVQSMLKKPMSPKQRSNFTFAVSEEPVEPEQAHGIDLERRDLPAQRQPSIPLSGERVQPLSAVDALRRETEKRIKRAFLLNAYPIMYIILWIPALLNRFVDASGHHSRALTIMQCSTQFVGLANAITYGLNEKVLTKLRERFGRKPGGRPDQRQVQGMQRF